MGYDLVVDDQTVGYLSYNYAHFILKFRDQSDERVKYINDLLDCLIQHFNTLTFSSDYVQNNYIPRESPLSEEEQKAKQTISQALETYKTVVNEFLSLQDNDLDENDCKYYEPFGKTIHCKLFDPLQTLNSLEKVIGSTGYFLFSPPTNEPKSYYGRDYNEWWFGCQIKGLEFVNRGIYNILETIKIFYMNKGKIAGINL